MEVMQRAKGDSSFHLKNEGHLLIVFGGVAEDFETNRDVQLIIEWEGDRNCDECNSYYSILNRIWERYTSWEPGCSSSHHDNMRLLSEYIGHLARFKREAVLRMMRDKINRLQAEAMALEEKLAKEQVNKSDNEV